MSLTDGSESLIGMLLTWYPLLVGIIELSRAKTFSMGYSSKLLTLLVPNFRLHLSSAFLF